uniref:Reverse transcriptase domain-containing protein n=1 Tax=Tanacetum cinerariifolium TaxID=118510 RepID=A0A699HW46_TANCI|nr:hypothetical protein [Tanacetum cinerariifolium]
MNQNIYNSNSSIFDQFEPPHCFDVHQPPEEISIDELKIMMQSNCEMMTQRREQAAQKKQDLLAEEQEANPFEPSPVSYFYNTDYNNISTPSTTYTIYLIKNEVKRIQQILEKTSFDAITPDFLITDSLSMGDEHLSTIPKMESDKVIKSSVKNLVPIPSESEVTSDNERRSDGKFQIYSNPLFDDEEIISTNIDPHYFNVESNLLKSLLNRDTLIDPFKFDYLLEEFSRELVHIDPIPPRIKEADFDLEEEIRLVENLSYDNSSPRPPEELNAEIADTIFKSLSPSPIPVEDSDSHMEEINLFLATDDLMPPGIEKDDYDSEGDIYFIEELLSNDPLPENKSSNFDHHDDPSFPRPHPKPMDAEVFFYFEPDTGVLTTKVVKDFTPFYDSLGFRNKIFDPRIFIEVQSERLLSREEFSISFIRDPLYPVFDTLLPFSFENEDKVFKPGILSYLLVSHQDKTTFDFSVNPMMMYGGDIPLLDVPYLHFYPLDQAQEWGIESGSRLG